MHLAPTTHEHAASAKVYTYEGDYEIGDDAIRWQAVVTHEGRERRLSGAIPVTTPAIGAVAEQAVRDAIVKGIDSSGSEGASR